MKVKARQVVSFVLSLLLIGFLLYSIDLKKFGTIISNVSPAYYFIAMGVYLSEYFVRAFRIKILFKQHKLFKINIFNAVQQLLNRTLPFRLGEVFFPVLLKKMFSISYAEGLHRLVFIRIMDLISLVFTFFLLASILGLDIQPNIYFLLVLIMVLLLVGTLTLKWTFPWFIRSGIKMTTGGLKSKLSDLLAYSNEMLGISAKVYFSIFFLSFIDKLMNMLVAILIIKGLGFEIQLFHLIAAMALSGLTEILPINSIGSFGTTELGWAGALIYLGINKEIAISSGLGFNLISYSFTILFGIISTLVLVYFYKINFLTIFSSKKAND